MVMKVQPLSDTFARVRRASESQGLAIYLTPQGRRLDQQGVRELALAPHLILLAGRYEGVDERLIEAEIDAEWSIGDYVLSGGELAAAVMVDALTRILPGALGHADSADEDSFADGLLDCPHYTRPDELDGRLVPPVLLSGDHAAIARWRLRESLGRTWLRRPDLLANRELDFAQRTLLDEYIREREQIRTGTRSDAAAD
jgi:tRNA (guanine37-N1)-methyltransferase